MLTDTITIQDLGFGLILTYKRRLYISFSFAVVSFAFMFALVFDKIHTSSADTIFFPVLGIVGFLFLYWAAANYLDSATITVTKQKVDVKRGPIPFLKDLTIEASNVSQVFHERRVINFRRRRWAPDASAESGEYVRYALGVITVDKREIILLKDIPSEGDANAIETEIERWLGIVDRPVEDELRSILAGSGLWTRLTHSSSTNTFVGSPLYHLLLAAPFVVWGSFILASGQVPIRRLIFMGRGSHMTVSFDKDPLTFSVLVLMILGAAGWCLYKSWKVFVETE